MRENDRYARYVGAVAQIGAAVGLVLLLAVVALAAPPSQTPTETPVGAISGQVGNATTGLPAGNVAVTLHRWQGDTELSPFTAQATADGHFQFQDLDTGDPVYQVEVTYDGVRFHSDFIRFDPGVTQMAVPVDVYETTDSPEAITVERFHFIIMLEEPGLLSVLELYQFSNRGDHAYVGTVNSDGQRETVRMALPAGAQDLALQGGTLGLDFLARDGHLVATSPVIPGVGTLDAAFFYFIPYSEDSISLDRTLYYDTASVNGLLMDAGARVQSGTLTFAGERVAQEQSFLQYTGQDLKAHTTLDITLESLDSIQALGAPDASGGAASTALPAGLNQTTVLWVMLGLGALGVAFALAYPRLRPRLRGKVKPGQTNLPLERQQLLLTLARLDQAYQAGQLDEAVYRHTRAQRKAQLAELWRQPGSGQPTKGENLMQEQVVLEGEVRSLHNFAADQWARREIIVRQDTALGYPRVRDGIRLIDSDGKEYDLTFIKGANRSGYTCLGQPGALEWWFKKRYAIDRVENDAIFLESTHWPEKVFRILTSAEWAGRRAR